MLEYQNHFANSNKILTAPNIKLRNWLIAAKLHALVLHVIDLLAILIQKDLLGVGHCIGLLVVVT